MKKIFFLSKILKTVGLSKESHEVMLLLKEASIHGIETLGIKHSAAKLFIDLVGEKWAFVIAKYYIEYNLGQSSSFEEYYSFYGSKDDKIIQIKALNACDSLLSKPTERRQEFCKKDNNCKGLKAWLMDNHLPDIKFTWEERKVDEWTVKYMRLESPFINPDDYILSLMQNLREDISKSIEYFIKDDFIKDLISGKYANARKAKSMTMKELKEEWMRQKPSQMPIVMKFDDNWAWIDAGGDKSSWVAKNLDNCGSVSWGNLKATSESGAKARMLILVDELMSPHAIVTWNPEYVEYDYPELPPRKYLGHIEGVGSQILDDKYHQYFLKLVDYLKPDQVFISNKSTYSADGKLKSSEDLKKKLDESILT